MRPVMNGGHNPNLNVHIRNNIFYQSGGVPYLICPSKGASKGIYGSNNLFYGSGAAPANTDITGSICKDPLFANVANQDFHLRSTSPARNAGVSTGVETDKDGILRDGQSRYDLGALQFIGP